MRAYLRFSRNGLINGVYHESECIEGVKYVLYNPAIDNYPWLKPSLEDRADEINDWNQHDTVHKCSKCGYVHVAGDICQDCGIFVCEECGKADYCERCNEYVCDECAKPADEEIGIYCDECRRYLEK